MSVFKVAVSAGHYPEAKGASYEGVSEFDIAKIWQPELVDAINEAANDYIGRHIYLQGKMISWGKLPAKVDEINRLKADLAIEIHFNAGAVTSGCETLFAPGSAKGTRAATLIQKEMSRSSGVRSRGAKEGWYKMDKPGVVDYAGDVEGDEKIDYFLRETSCPAIIIEPEFISQLDTIERIRKPVISAIVGVIGMFAEEKHARVNRPPEEQESGKSKKYF
jgi:hypothetical protein